MHTRTKTFSRTGMLTMCSVLRFTNSDYHFDIFKLLKRSVPAIKLLDYNTGTCLNQHIFIIHTYPVYQCEQYRYIDRDKCLTQVIKMNPYKRLQVNKAIKKLTYKQKQKQKYFIKQIKDPCGFIISYNDYNDQNT